MNIVKVEAYEGTFHGRHIRWFVKESHAVYPPGFLEQITTESPPFQKRILLLSPISTEAWKLTDRWDAVFVPHSSTDWSLILGFLQHQTHALVVCTPEVAVPPAFLTKCRQLKLTPTVILFQVLRDEPYKPLQQIYDDTFFPTIEESSLEAVQTILQQILPHETLKQLSLREVVRDIKGAGASLVVSRQGELYWYYMTDSKKSRNLWSHVIHTLVERDA